MPRTLYGLVQSPFVRMVALTLDQLGLDYEFKKVNLLEGEHKKPEYLKVSLEHQLVDRHCLNNKFVFSAKPSGQDPLLHRRRWLWHQREPCDRRVPGPEVRHQQEALPGRSPGAGHHQPEAVL